MRMLFGATATLKENDIVPNGESFKAIVADLESKVLADLPPEATLVLMEMPVDGLFMCERSKVHPGLRILVAGDLSTGERLLRVDCLMEDPVLA